MVIKTQTRMSNFLLFISIGSSMYFWMIKLDDFIWPLFLSSSAGFAMVCGGFSAWCSFSYTLSSRLQRYNCSVRGTPVVYSSINRLKSSILLKTWIPIPLLNPVHFKIHTLCPRECDFGMMNLEVCETFILSWIFCKIGKVIPPHFWFTSSTFALFEIVLK